MSAERSQMLKPKPILTLILFPSHSTWALLFIWEYFRDIFVKLQWQQLSLCCVWFQRQAKCEAALQQMEAEEREVKVEAANSWKPHFTAAASPHHEIYPITVIWRRQSRTPKTLVLLHCGFGKSHAQIWLFLVCHSVLWSTGRKDLISPLEREQMISVFIWKWCRILYKYELNPVTVPATTETN